MLVFLLIFLSSVGSNSCLSLEFYPANFPFHQIGKPINSSFWQATTEDSTNKFLSYGPYTKDWNTTSPSRVDFHLGIDNNSADRLTVLTVDVHDADTDEILTSRNISRHDFDKDENQLQIFSLYFSTTIGHQLEFRVYYHCCSEIIHYKTVINVLNPGPLGNIFDGNAGLEFVSGSVFPTPHADPSSTAMWNVGTFLKPLNGVWYVFYREGFYAPTPSFCDGIVPLTRIAVRNSSDHGLTWSEPSTVALPGNSTFDNCAILDGAGFYDNETNTWHYLAQCIGDNRRWSLCHYSRFGNNPTAGVFTPNSRNPVVQGGQLWSQICSGTGKHCTMTMYDEGTPEIVDKKNGWFYITFHGWDGPKNRAARGVARTQDFVNYEVSGYTLPGDAIFSSLDCDSWHIMWNSTSLCVGGGEGSMVRSGDYFYHLIEAPDISLNCDVTLGEQNWVLGLLRSPTLATVSGQWEQIHFNPAFKPAKKYGCGLQYHRIFHDGDDFFFSMFVIDFGVNNLIMKIWKVGSGITTFPVVVGYP